MTQAPGAGNDLAAQISALKAELEAETARNQANTPVEPSAVVNAGVTDAPVPSTTDEQTLGELARQLRETDVPDTTATKTFRVVVATDWSSATVPMAVLRAYATMFPTDAPVELVFAVPQEPTQTDLDAVRILFEGLDGIEDTAAMQIESFAEVTGRACYAAIVPTGDPDALIMELSVLFTQLHHLADLVRDPAKLAEEPAPTTGFNAGLSRRLAEFRTAGV